jgi:hypothetical protein
MYVPKSKIKQYQTTIGREYFINTPNLVLTPEYEGYIGQYYKLYDGTAYTGDYPGDGENKLLTPFSTLDTPNIPTSLTTTIIPPLFPTPKDYEVGIFTRYFIKKRNEFLFDELTKDQYNNVNTTLYIKFQIQWQLVGDKDATYTTNRNMVLLAEQKNKVPGLSTYLKEDYLKYYK